MSLILTLDAGGTNLVFSAVRDGVPAGKSISLKSPSEDLSQFLNALCKGFEEIKDQFTESADAISFSFPGPADYRNGVIGDLQNLPAFRGEVALGPYLKEQLGIPVFVSNDGDMFALGEAKRGFLPWINQMLADSGKERKYNNLIAITLGTGFGAGIVINDRLLNGDTGSAAEAWLLRNKVHGYTNVEDILSIRAVKRMYAEQIHIDPARAPEPVDLFRIATGDKDGVREAAVESWYRYGEVLGDAIAQINTMIDGAIVIGGGLSGAYPIFKNSMMDELNGSYKPLAGNKIRRSVQTYFNIEEEHHLKDFVKPVTADTKIPGSEKEIIFQKEKKIPVGVSRLGTNKAISLGCYYYAMEQLSSSFSGAS